MKVILSTLIVAGFHPLIAAVQLALTIAGQLVAGAWARRGCGGKGSEPRHIERMSP